MAIYNNIALNSVQEHQIISYDNLMEFCFDSLLEFNSIFERANTIIGLQEDNALAVPFKVSLAGEDSEPEKVKKKFGEFIKEAMNKFLGYVKGLFEKLKETIHKFYMEHNLTDSIMSKYKDIVIFKNVEKAKEKGWKGIPISIPMIKNPASVRGLSSLYEEANRNSEFFESTVKKISNNLDKLKDSTSVEDSQSEFNDFEENLKKFKQDISRESEYSTKFRNNMNANPIFGDAKQEYFDYQMLYCLPSNYDEEKGYYYPIAEQFGTTVSMAVNGQKYIKSVSSNYKSSIKDLKMDKELYRYNSKTNTKSANKSDNEIAKIDMYYWKAMYQYSTAFIQRSAAISRTVVQILKEQHMISIKFYLYCLPVCKKYAEKAEA